MLGDAPGCRPSGKGFECGLATKVLLYNLYVAGVIRSTSVIKFVPH